MIRIRHPGCRCKLEARRKRGLEGAERTVKGCAIRVQVKVQSTTFLECHVDCCSDERAITDHRNCQGSPRFFSS